MSICHCRVHAGDKLMKLACKVSFILCSSGYLEHYFPFPHPPLKIFQCFSLYKNHLCKQWHNRTQNFAPSFNSEFHTHNHSMAFSISHVHDSCTARGATPQLFFFCKLMVLHDSVKISVFDFSIKLYYPKWVVRLS